MPYHYAAYGLSIASELECPELTAIETVDAADITITVVEIPARITDPRHTAPHVQVGEGVVQFESDGSARYRVVGGHTILVQPLAGSAPENVRLHLLGTALGVLLHQRGRLPLHASAVERDGGAIAFCGHSGAGKSTLAAALSRRGYPLLCDDVGVVVPGADGVPLFYPGFPRIKLWRDALDHFQLDSAGLLRDWVRAEKFHLPFQGLFQCRPLPLREVCFLERSSSAERVAVYPLTGAQGVPMLVEHTYRPRMVRWLGDSRAHFRHCARLAESAKLFRYARPWALDRLEESLDVLLGGLAARGE